MIAYHGTPVGGTRQDCARLLAGRHALVPFPRQDDMGIVADVCQSFVFDNGAFSVWKKGGKLDVDGYTAWVEQWHRHPGFDWALIPDVIDGDEAANDALLEAWLKELRGVPVWHLQESLERLQRLAAGWPTVAIGSSGLWAHPGTAAWWKRMGSAMDAICDDQGRPACRLHGLRMLDPRNISEPALRFSRQHERCGERRSISRFGMYAPPTAGQRANVIADRIESHDSSPIWLRETQAEMAL